MSLFSNIRFYILLFSSILFVGVIIFVFNTYESQTLQIIRLNQITAFISLFFLYLSLLPSPLYSVFPTLPGKIKFTKARRAIGVSAFLYACIHAVIAFSGQLGGFEGLGFLTTRYLTALFLGFLSLQILFLLAITSFDRMIAILSFPRWKKLHRLVYIAFWGILLHGIMLGTHLTTTSSIIFQLTLFSVILLIILEAVRIDIYLRKKINKLNIGLISGMAIGVIITFFLLTSFSQTPVSLGIHSQHQKIAFQAQQNSLQNYKNPALTGDRSKRFTVGFSPRFAYANSPTMLEFQIFDASNGMPTILYNKIYDKLMHLIIVDSSLTYFDHIHPELEENIFSIETSFPKEGRYHLYTDYQPFGAIEQQDAFTLFVGNTLSEQKPNQVEKYTDSEGGYTISLTKRNFSAREMSLGNVRMTFTIKDVKGQPVTTLKPYLASFGHLVMINTATYDYVHVHPFDLKTPKPNSSSGPTVEFLPMGLYGPIKPGIYRVFAQFNPNNSLITTDFTIQIL